MRRCEAVIVARCLLEQVLLKDTILPLCEGRPVEMDW